MRGRPPALSSISLATGLTTGLFGTALSTSSGGVPTAGVSGVRGEIPGPGGGTFSAGVRGINWNTGSAGMGVVGSQSGSGSGVYGEAASGAGVLGVTRQAVSTAAGVRAQYGGLGVGTALEVNNGGIKTSGAIRFAFIHTVTTLNRLLSSGVIVATLIDHPMSNNDPNAILIVTPRIDDGISTTGPVVVQYNESYNGWFIWKQSGSMPLGSKLNVLVIKQ